MPKKYKLNKSGRKRDPNAKRRQTTAMGQGRTTEPTPELLAKKEMATNSRSLIAEFPPSCLFGKGLINSDEHSAAWEYFSLYTKVYKSPHAKATTAFLENAIDITQAIDEEHETKCFEKIKAAEQVLKSESVDLFKTVRRACISWEIYSNLNKPNLTPLEKHEIGKIEKGLRIIADVFSGRKKR
ncbi:MAG: hypothetical protein CMP22_07760 [Rickettsiales bacterium]|nr:hypothetical protein [Rickettsiales bacterium]